MCKVMEYLFGLMFRAYIVYIVQPAIHERSFVVLLNLHVLKLCVSSSSVSDKIMQFLYLILLVINVKNVISEEFVDFDEFLIDIDLPENHLSQYFNNLPELAKKINESTNGYHKEFLSSEKYDRKVCWGYELECENPVQTHICRGNHTGYVKSKETQLDIFYTQADFGNFFVFQGRK